MRVLLTGAGGQLGQELRRVLAGEEVVALSHAELDITDPAAVTPRVEQLHPDWVINAAGFNLVDAAEEDAETAFRVNASGTLNLARAARAASAGLVHFSSNYVFDGRKGAPYTEADPPNPLNVYGLSKLSGEFLARGSLEKHLLVRTCGLYGAGSRTKGGNFVERMLRAAHEGRALRVVSDQVATPTSARELAERVVLLLRRGACGLYHLTNAGQCSWYEFAREIFRLAGLSPRLEPVTSAEYAARARRPLYSVLENAAYQAAGLPPFRPWQEALADYLRQRV